MKNKKNSFLLLSLIIFMMGGIFITTENVKACSCAKGSFCLAGGCMTAWATTGSACSQNLFQHVCTIDSVSAASHSVCLIAPTGATTCKAGQACTTDGHKYCTEDKCGIYVDGVDEFHTAKDWSTDGDICKVTEDTFLSCSAPVLGKWDYKEGKCVNCQAGTNKEINVCGDLTGTYFNGINCTKAGDNQFESACGADASCDEQVEGYVCDTGKECDSSGQCVVVSGLSLSASASPTTVATGGSSTITFTVTNTTGNVSGATVSGISITVGGGSVSAGSCNTNASGECTVTYNAPAVSTVATIEAAKATKIGETDSGSANTNVTVSSCTVDTTVKFGSNSYSVGDSLDIMWRVGALESDNNYTICIYDESGGDVWDKTIVHFEDITFPFTNGSLGSYNLVTADASGTWMASLSIGLSCATSGCIDSATVSVAGPGPCVPVISCVDSACLETTPTSAGFTSTCTNSCTGAVTTTTSACCLKDDHCAGGTPACNLVTEQCVECVVDDDCVGTDVCNNHLCTPCSGEGIDPGDAALCCFGLSYLDIDGDGTFACTSACDPNSWFFCNPLRGTVETIVQAGETMLGYILGLIGSIALLFIIIAGMMYMTSAGNEERISSSKKILTGAVIGLMIALLAYGMLHVIMTVLDM